MSLGLCSQLPAQTGIDLTRQGKIESGTQAPAQCIPGQLFIKSDAPMGPLLQICTAANVWSSPGLYSAGSGIAITGNAIAAEDAVIPMYYAGAGAPTLDCAPGRDFSVDTTAGVLYYCKAAGQWQAALTAGANTYAAGQRQSMAHDGTNAGLRLVPSPGDPAGAVDGDLWYNRDTGKFRRRQNGAVTDWDAGVMSHNLLGPTHSDTSAGTVTRGDLITGQGAPATWARLPLSGAGSYLRSNGTDLVYSQIPINDLPSGYSWANLANVPAGFTPSAHGSAHLSNGSDPIPAAGISTRGTVTTTTANSQVVSTDDSRMSNARTPSAHASTHKNGGADEIATAAPAANAIPKAGAAGTLAAGWLPSPGVASLGGVQSKDCSGTGHVQKVNTDGSVTCSADSGGGGVTIGAGAAGPICISGGCDSPTSSGHVLAANTVYYAQEIFHTAISVKQLLIYMNPGTGTNHFALALMDSSCAKVPGTDITYTLTGSAFSNQPWASNTTIGPGVYYLAVVTDAPSGNVQAYTNSSTFPANGAYSGSTPSLFSGSTPPTGSGASLQVPASCGTKSGQLVGTYAPIFFVVP